MPESAKAIGWTSRLASVPMQVLSQEVANSAIVEAAENMSELDVEPIRPTSCATFWTTVADGISFELDACMRRIVPCGYSSGWRILPVDIVTHHEGGLSELELDDGRVLRCADGEGLCIPANTRHESRAAGESPAVSCWTSGVFRLWGSIPFLSLFETPCVLPAPVAAVIGQLSREMRQAACLLGELERATAIRSIGLGLAAAVAGSVPTSHRFDLVISHADRLRPALEYMASNLADVTIDDLADLLCVSPRRFHALFHAAMGTAPHQYLQTLRIQRAKQLLISSGLGVQEVGRLCGFADPFHFSRTFRAKVGVSPRSYKTLPAARPYE